MRLQKEHNAGVAEWNYLLANPSTTECQNYLDERNALHADIREACNAELQSADLHTLVHDCSAYTAAVKAIKDKWAAVAEERLEELNERLGKRIIRNCGGAEVTDEDRERVRNSVLCGNGKTLHRYERLARRKAYLAKAA